jgi:hypothetical protein
MFSLAKAQLGDTSTPSRLPHIAYGQPIEKVAIEFACHHVSWSGRLRLLSMVEDSAHRKNKSLPSWVPDPSAPLLPLPLDGGVLEDEVPVKWDATGSKDYLQVPAIQNKLLVVYGFRIDVVRMAAIQFNDLIDTEKWIELLLGFLEPLKNDIISRVSFDEAFWKTLLATTKTPLRKHGATIGREEFRDWIISIVLTLGKGNDGFKDRGGSVGAVESFTDRKW